MCLRVFVCFVDCVVYIHFVLYTSCRLMTRNIVQVLACRAGINYIFTISPRFICCFLIIGSASLAKRTGFSFCSSSTSAVGSSSEKDPINQGHHAAVGIPAFPVALFPMGTPVSTFWGCAFILGVCHVRFL